MRTSRFDIPVVAVAGGKGGVGKSSIALALARALTADGLRVGVVDADLHGPDIPRMVGLRRDVPATTLRLVDFTQQTPDLEAIEVDGMQVASVGFLLAGTQAFAMGTTFGELLLARLITRTRWEDRDVLILDLPAGATDLVKTLPGITDNLAVLFVVTPAEVAHLDSHRLITVLHQYEIPILGGVENMAYLSCPDCTHRIALHPPAEPDRTIWSRGIPQLASLPFRPGSTPSATDLNAVTTAVRTHLSPNP